MEVIKELPGIIVLDGIMVLQTDQYSELYDKYDILVLDNIVVNMESIKLIYASFSSGFC